MVELFEVEENDLEDDATSGDGADAAGQTVGKAGRPAYNIAPTDKVAVVLERLREPVSSTEADDQAGDQAGDEDDAQNADPTPSELAELSALSGLSGLSDSPGQPAPPVPVRQLRALTWGLVPSWSKDRSGGARMINARAEGLLDKPAYRKAAVSRRCLVPADGWYEWQVDPAERDAKGKPRKQPFFMSPAEGGMLAFAGIYEFWRDRELHADDPQAWLVTFAIITTAAEPDLARIHDRMPLVLPAERWPDWLDPQLREPDAVRALLQAPQPGRFSAVPISTRVNSVRNDGPELLEPAQAEQGAEQLF